MHALPVNSDTRGVAFELSGINTADHARLNLMSMTEFYEKWGYDVSFKHDGFTSFYKTDPVSIGAGEPRRVGVIVKRQFIDLGQKPTQNVRIYKIIE